MNDTSELMWAEVGGQLRIAPGKSQTPSLPSELFTPFTPCSTTVSINPRTTDIKTPDNHRRTLCRELNPLGICVGVYMWGERRKVWETAER